jgi:hypothetical protein
MNRLPAIALAAALFAPVAAHADNGQWLDTRNRIAPGGLPESSEAIARLQFAKVSCHQHEGTEMGAAVTARYMPCMKSQGFVWIADSPTQIATREKAAQDARNRETLHAIGGALIDAGAALQPHGCNGYVQRNGYFSTQCF